MILKEIRKAKGISQDKAAEDLGISLRAYQNYEYGAREPNLEMLNKLADYFEVTVDYLLGREKAPDPFGELNLSTEDEREVLAKYMSLPENVRAILLDVLIQLGDAARARTAADCGEIKQSRPTVWIKKHLNRASAGFGYDLSENDEWDEIEVLDTPKAAEADFAVQVDGDSMLPDFRDGDIALIKFDPDVPVGKVGLFIVDNMGYIKERGKKCLISRNPDYPNIKGEARCVGLVIGIAELV